MMSVDPPVETLGIQFRNWSLPQPVYQTPPACQSGAFDATIVLQ